MLADLSGELGQTTDFTFVVGRQFIDDHLHGFLEMCPDSKLLALKKEESESIQIREGNRWLARALRHR